jgi:acetyl-CoA synthetase
METSHPNVIDYEEYCRDFKWEVPEYYNFAFDVIDRRADERDGTALVSVSPDGERARIHTFRDLSVLSNKFANVLLEHGATRGVRVFVMLPRIPEWYVAVLGTLKLSGIYMPTPTLSTAKDLKYRLSMSEAEVVVTSPEFADRIDGARKDCPALKRCILVGGEKEGWISCEKAMSAASPALTLGRSQKTRSSDPMLVFFTSGTEGPPKMVLHDYSYAIGHYVTAYVIQDLKPGDVVWTLADTGWAKAAYGKFFGQWMVGATVLQWNARGRFNPLIAVRILEKYGVTVFCAPPTGYRMIIRDGLDGFIFPRLRHALSAGEPLNPEVIREWKKATGIEIHDYYGQTETVPLITNMLAFPIRPGSMGKAVPGHEVAIVDDKGRELPAGEEGHIAVNISRDRPSGLMREYWKDDAENRRAFRDGWYYTGDRAYKDGDGYFWFMGRADDVINSSSYRIGPFEVESALQEHPAVVESAVVGISDELRGQVVKAFVVLARGYEPSEELTNELQEYVKKLTAPYKYPRIIEYKAGLPKTTRGKIKRAELRKLG